MFLKTGLPIPLIEITREVWSNRFSVSISDLLIRNLWYLGPGNVHFKIMPSNSLCTPRIARIEPVILAFYHTVPPFALFCTRKQELLNILEVSSTGWQDAETWPLRSDWGFSLGSAHSWWILYSIWREKKKGISGIQRLNSLRIPGILQNSLISGFRTPSANNVSGRPPSAI